MSEAQFEKVKKGLKAHGCGKSVWRICSNCPYQEKDNPFFDPRISPNYALRRKSRYCIDDLLKDTFSLIHAQQARIKEMEAAAAWNRRTDEEKLLVDFLLDAEASNSILNSVRCHNMSLDTVSRIIMLCGPACDTLSPDGFIKWLKGKMADDPRIREEMENDRM
ncbi:MAG: hypothetical protein IJ523_10430 [Succinivibrionaceae bacterium]|nr:hypothetical protein [Succinivibrionaceae bacterium]